MNHAPSESKKLLSFEVGLLCLFTVTLLAYLFGAIPENLRIFILGSVSLVGLYPVLKSTAQSLRNKKINVDLLASIALVFSLLAQEWESVLFINAMLSLARIFGIITERRVQNSLESLRKLKPSQAHVLRNDKTTTIPIADLSLGDLVLVNLGEQIPVDGRITEGNATVDQSSLTGESVPVLRAKNDIVLASTLVVSGNIIISTEKIGTQTIFERMISLVESSQGAKTRMKTLTERFASWYIGIMLVVSLVLYLVTGDVKLVLAVVLVVCADDIAIAIPLAYIVAMGTAAKRGILIKGADFLERASKISTLIVDKTGTLTMGQLSVQSARPFGNIPLSQVLELSGIICSRSTHPASKAIARHATEQGLSCKASGVFQETEGQGIAGVNQQNQKITLGKPKFLEEQGIPITPEIASAITEALSKSSSVTLIAVEKNIVGLFELSDKLRPDVDRTIAALRKSGVKKIVMLTGDNEHVAKTIAEHGKLNAYHANLLPEHKVSILETYLNKKDVVAMLGDGVNDAACITRADVGIAMGGIGSDAAINSADIILMNDDFAKLLELRDIAQRVTNVAYQNFAIWALVNILGLYFVFAGVFDPKDAAAYNFLTDFIPVANALRLYQYKAKRYNNNTGRPDNQKLA